MSESNDKLKGVRPSGERIVVPRKHGQVLVEPGLDALAKVLIGRGSSGEAGRDVFGVDAKLARAEFLAAANAWAERTGALPVAEDALGRAWVVTGHQVEFFHAGVWAKMIATDELARRTGAVPFDLLVDHDVVDHMGMDVPQREGAAWKRKSVTWAAGQITPADGLQAPTVAQFEEWDAELARESEVHSDALAMVLSTLRGSLAKDAGGEGSYTPWMSRGRYRLEQALGIEVHHVPTSLLCRTKSWHRFVRAWVENAEGWSRIYNEKLEGYRKQHGIKNRQQPMPDLHVGVDGEVELPFWIYRVGEARERLVIRKAGGKVMVKQSGKEMDFDAVGDGVVIRPRALTLTMFVRVFLADVFVHGIGGALYDQITDEILQELTGDLPAYGCVSAAWLLPLGQAYVPEDISGLRWRRHHAKHNPQLAIDPFTALKTDVAELITLRKELVGNLLREGAAKDERKAWFDQLQDVNRALHAKAPRVLSNLDRQIADAQQHAEENQTLLWREWYFALHSMESLEKLIRAVRGQG